MASATVSVAKPALQANGKGFAEFSGLRNSTASLPFARKTSEDFLSIIAFQTSALGSNNGRYRKGVIEAKLKVAINGFGRIGRNFLRCLHGRKDSPLDVIAINDTGGVKQASHLLKYDSTLGIFEADVKPVGDDGISVDGKVIKVVSNRNPVNLPWKDLGIDLVIEGTGVFVDRDGAGKHIQAGAKKVLITAPGKGDIPTYVVGVNADSYNPDEPIISNASCTTNCLAPFVKVLDQKFGIIKGTMTTTHSYTGDQRLLDASHRDLRRARAAALNIVPTSTGAAKAVALVLPTLKGKLNGIALRVPTPNVSVVDLVVQVSKKTFAEEVNAAFRESAEKELKGILSVCDEPLVSVDFRCSDVSSTVDASLTMVMGDDMVKVIAWYDNEWGYSQRVVDLFELFHKAIAGGVVPPFLVSTTESETCLPARENGWGRLRQKFANGIMKEFVNSSKLGCNLTSVSDRSDMVIDIHRDSEDNISLSSPSSLSIFPCGSPDSFDCFPDISPIRSKDHCEEVEQSVTPFDSPLAPRSPCGSPNSFSCFAASSPKFSSKSPTLSPSTSDYASSFTFSPSSSNWSDLSYLCSRQPSPSGREATDLFSIKNVSSPDNSCLPYKESFPSPTKTFSSDLTLRVANTCLPCKGTSPSIAERRGSHPPPRMLLPSVAETVPRKLVRSWSFSMPDSDDDVMNEIDYNQYEPEDNREELMLDAESVGASIESHSGTEDKREYGECHPQFGGIFEKGSGVTTSVLYQWPTLNKVEMRGSHILESGAAYMLLAPDASLGASDHSAVLYVWRGREVLCEKGQSQFVSCDGTDNDNHPYWESIARDFLNKMDLPLNASIQIVTEGEEPEQFLNLFNCFIVPEG